MSSAAFLSGKDISTEIKRLFESEEAIKCAVAFWGEGSLKILKNFHKPIQIICNLESGGTNPHVIRELRKRKNVQIRTHGKIHAKVYLAEDYRAIIGSSNMSSNGLSFESEELEGWIEANVLITAPELLRKIKHWFNALWKDASAISEHQLKKAETLWLRRRNSRPRSGYVRGNGSLLRILRDNRELFKDRKIYISLWRDESTPEADATLEQFRNENKFPKGSELGLYEDWRNLPSDAYLVDLYYDRKSVKANSFEGIYRIQDSPIVREFRRKNGKRGFITVCVETNKICIADLNLKIDKNDEKFLKRKIKQLWNSPISKGDNYGKLVSLYDARSILF